MKLLEAAYVDEGFWLEKGFYPPTVGMIKERRRDRRMGLCATSALSLSTLARRVESSDDFKTVEAKARQLHGYVDPAGKFPAVGMAEPQLLGSDALRIFSAALGMKRQGDARTEVVTLVNPTVIPVGNKKTRAIEHCCSARWILGEVERYASVVLHGTTLEGKVVHRQVSGWSARVVQHEFDHLEGILCSRRTEDQGDPLYYVPRDLLKVMNDYRRVGEAWPMVYTLEQLQATLSGKFSLERYL